MSTKNRAAQLSGLYLRRVTVAGEIRASAPGKPSRIEGYASVFNEESEIIPDFWGPFIETVADSAFTATLASDPDVRALLNHDPNFILGRTRSNTLRLYEDSRGLGYEVTPPDAQWARDLMESIRRGDISQSSFGFRTVRDRWSTTERDGVKMDLRTLLEVQLIDVSPATFPAYPAASSGVRSLGQMTEEELRTLIASILNGSLAERAGAGSSVAGALHSPVAAPAPLPQLEPSPDPLTDARPVPTGHRSADDARRRLQIVEATLGLNRRSA